MQGNFVILLDGNLKTYTDYNDIPDLFDNLIQCEFDYPEGPHTEEEHEVMDQYNDLLQELMKRETK